MLIDLDRLVPFALAALILVLIPGPNQALVIARSISGGRRAGMTASFGLNTGTLVHALAAGLGLSAILATSATAFTIVKIAGAAYLIYLGLRMVLSRDSQHAPDVPTSQSQSWQDGYLKALMTGILNPKVAIFFLAFLPQFVDKSAGPVFPQFLILGLVLASIGLIVDSLVATGAGTLGRFLRCNPTFALWQERITGLAFVALGVRLAFEKR